MDVLSSMGKVDSMAGAGNRESGAGNVSCGSASFSATLAAQDTAEPKVDEASAQGDGLASQQTEAQQSKPKGENDTDAESADDGSEADKAAAAAATLAQMLAAAAPASGVITADPAGTSASPGLTDRLPSNPLPVANLTTSAAQGPAATEGEQSAGSANAGQSGFAALASLIEVDLKPESNMASPSTEAKPSTPATPQAPPSSGGAVLSLLTNPLRTSALAQTLDAGPAAHLQAAVGSHEWAEELGTRLAVMTAQGDQTGSLRLSPEHLGPLEVQIRMQDDKANVVFGAQHADTRRALEEALPRLREMFAASGLQLGEAGVSREAPRQAQGAWSSRTAGGLSGQEADLAAPVAGVQRAYHVGLLDTVA